MQSYYNVAMWRGCLCQAFSAGDHASYEATSEFDRLAVATGLGEATETGRPDLVNFHEAKIAQ